MLTTLTDLVSKSRPMDVVEQVIDVWDDDEGDRSRQELLDDLESFRATSSQDEVHDLAWVIYSTLINFGEEASDMYWVHVAVICDELLRLGVPA